MPKLPSLEPASHSSTGSPTRSGVAWVLSDHLPPEGGWLKTRMYHTFSRAVTVAGPGTGSGTNYRCWWVVGRRGLVVDDVGVS